MPIRKFPFLPLDSVLRPLLPIVIINPHTGKRHKTYGIIDTGADACTLPAELAVVLGHSLKKGDMSVATVVGAKVKTWCHTTTIQMLNRNGEAFFMIRNAKVEYVDKFEHVILGVDDFLCKFRLDIDYPNKCFSIRYSKTKKLKVPAP